MSSRTPASIAYVIVTAALWLVGLPGALVTESDTGVPWRSGAALVAAVVLAGGGLVLVDRGAAALSRAGVGLFGVAPGPGLVVDGLYGRLRNPIEVGTIVLSFVPWIALDLDLVWLVPAGAVVWIVGGVGPYEDRRLFEEFGDEFSTYRSRVPKWLPRR